METSVGSVQARIQSQGILDWERIQNWVAQLGILSIVRVWLRAGGGHRSGSGPKQPVGGSDPEKEADGCDHCREYPAERDQGRSRHWTTKPAQLRTAWTLRWRARSRLECADHGKFPLLIGSRVLSERHLCPTENRIQQIEAANRATGGVGTDRLMLLVAHHIQKWANLATGRPAP